MATKNSKTPMVKQSQMTHRHKVSQKKTKYKTIKLANKSSKSKTATGKPIKENKKTKKIAIKKKITNQKIIKKDKVISKSYIKQAAILSGEEVLKDSSTEGIKRAQHLTTILTLSSIFKVAGILIYPIVALAEFITLHYKETKQHNENLINKLKNDEISVTQIQTIQDKNLDLQSKSTNYYLNFAALIATIAVTIPVILTGSAVTASIGPLVIGALLLITLIKTGINITHSLSMLITSDSKEERLVHIKNLAENIISLILMVVFIAILSVTPVNSVAVMSLFFASSILAFAYLGYKVYKTRQQAKASEADLAELIQEKELDGFRKQNNINPNNNELSKIVEHKHTHAHHQALENCKRQTTKNKNNEKSLKKSRKRSKEETLETIHIPKKSKTNK